MYDLFDNFIKQSDKTETLIIGTNNIIMNRALLELVGKASENRIIVNAFVYNILLHEYLHALGYLREVEVRPLVLKISQECFGLDHEVAQLARSGPWSILRDIPLDDVRGSHRVIEVVKDFEQSATKYIV